LIEAKLFAYKLLDAIREDDPFWDLSSQLVPAVSAEGSVVVKDQRPCVIAGVEEVVEFLRLLDVDVFPFKKDGDLASRGETVMRLVGPAPELLKVERTVLNVLSMASGIATQTRRAVEAARAVNPKVRVAATRKTSPFLRYLQKRAVMIGGGDPHRFSLSDAVLIKDNHVRLMGLEASISSAKKSAPFMAKVEVEVSNPHEALMAARLGADVVMLDNFSPEEAKLADELLTREGLRERVTVEISGGITEDNVALYAPHADVLSMGSLTHSFKAVDLSMELEAKEKKGEIEASKRRDKRITR